MASETLSCPYCNARLPLAEVTVGGRRSFCPRCGELIPERLVREVNGTTGGNTEGPASPAGVAEPPVPSGSDPDAVPSGPRVSNRFIAGVVLAVMIAVALVVLQFALDTYLVRRSHDTHMPRPPRRVSVPFYISVAAKVWLLGLIYVVYRGQSRKSRGAEPATPTGYLAGAGRDLRAYAEPQPEKVGFRFTLVAATAAVILGLAWDVSKLLLAARGPLPQPGATTAEAPPLRPLAPAELEGLRYLPADTDVITAVHVAELLSEPTAKGLLSRLRVGPTEFSLAGIRNWTGFDPEDVDHVVVGLKINGRRLPRWTLVVRTNRPIDLATVQEVVRNHRPPEAFRSPTSKVLVMAATPRELDAVPQEPDLGLGRLAAPLRGVIQERLGKTSQVWAVAHAGDWGNTAAGPLLPGLPQEERKVIAGIRTVGVWLEVGQEVTVNAAAECADDAGAGALDRFLERWQKDGVKHVTDANWVSAQFRTTPEAARKALEKPGGAAEKKGAGP